MHAPAPVGTVSHYRLLELLGRGAMGEVWLAEDTELPRKVAVKLLPRHLAEDPDAVERLLREARAAASIDHPAVVTVYEAGVSDGRPFLVMQRVEGETLEQRLMRGNLTPDETIGLGVRLADALAEVHALGIVHRDLKPSNVILSLRGPKVLDFGVASIKGSPRLTATGVAVGTPLMMSPEQIQGRPPDNRTDLWALGVILYRALTGQLPFAGERSETVMHAILNSQPQPPSATRSGVGRDLDYIVMKLLRKDPTHRYARAEELIADLQSCETTGTRQAVSSTGVPASTGPATRGLAVVPFEVMSSDPDDAFLAAGLVEDLIVDLARVQGLRVSSRADVQPYAHRTVPTRTLARELGVDYVVLGSVRRAGNRARINAQVMRALDGHTMWADRFDRTVEDLFDVQAEVSKGIVESLRHALEPGEREMLERPPTHSTEAYALYLRARQLLDGQRTREANMLAQDLLADAIEKDAGFALAHAALGESHARRALSWWAGLEAAEQAYPCAQRALEIEPDLLEGHLVMAMVHRIRGDLEPLAQVTERIVLKDPDHTQALFWSGWTYLAMGKPERALVVFERLRERRPDHYLSWSFLSQCYEALGRPEDSQAAYRQTREQLLDELRKRPENLHARSLLGTVLIRLGEVEKGLVQVERTIAAAPGDGTMRYNAACSYAQAGQLDRAIAEIKEGIRNLPSYLSDWPRHDPDLVKLHDHPEFVRLFGSGEAMRPATAGARTGGA